MKISYIYIFLLYKIPQSSYASCLPPDAAQHKRSQVQKGSHIQSLRLDDFTKSHQDSIYPLSDPTSPTTNTSPAGAAPKPDHQQICLKNHSQLVPNPNPHLHCRRRVHRYFLERFRLQASDSLEAKIQSVLLNAPNLLPPFISLLSWLVITSKSVFFFLI